MYNKKDFMNNTNLSSKKGKIETTIKSTNKKKNNTKKTPEQSFRGLMDQYMVSQIKKEHQKDAIQRIEKNREDERVQKELKNRLNKMSEKIGDFIQSSLGDINAFFKKSFIKLTLKNSGKNGRKVAYVSDMTSKNIKEKPLKSLNKQWNKIVDNAYKNEIKSTPDFEKHTHKENLLAQSSKALHKIRNNLLGWESIKTTVSPILAKVLGGPTGYTVKNGKGYIGRTAYNEQPSLECLNSKEKTRQLMFDDLISNKKRKDVELFLKSFGIKKPENRTEIELKSMCKKLINIDVPKNKKDIVEKFGKKHENSSYDDVTLSNKIKKSINAKIDKFLDKHFIFNEALTPMTPILYNDNNLLEANKINRYIDASKMTQLFGSFEKFWNKTYEQINPHETRDNTPEVDIKDISLHNIDTRNYGSSFDAVKDEINKKETKNDNIFIHLNEVGNMQDLMKAEIYSYNNNKNIVPTFMSSINVLPNGIYKIIDDLEDVKNIVGYLNIEDNKITLLNEKKQEHNIEGPSSFAKTGRPLNWALNGNVLSKQEHEIASNQLDIASLRTYNNTNQPAQSIDNDVIVPKTEPTQSVNNDVIVISEGETLKDIRNTPTPIISKIKIIDTKEPDLLTDPSLLEGHKKTKAEAILYNILTALKEYEMAKKHAEEHTKNEFESEIKHFSHIVAEQTASAFMANA